MPAVLKAAELKGSESSNLSASSTIERNVVYHLFLDDVRMPGHVTWINLPDAVYEVVRNYKQFVKTIETHGVPEFVTFDHDLADEHYKHMILDCQENAKFKKLFEVADEIKPHDYGPEKTGYECAKWLVDYCHDNATKFPEFTVHSMNPVGTERIKQYIENAKKHLDI